MTEPRTICSLCGMKVAENETYPSRCEANAGGPHTVPETNGGPSLDVERLAEAMTNVIDRGGPRRMSVMAAAEDYGAEYERLGEPIG